MLRHGANPNSVGHHVGYAFTYESGYTRNDTLFPLMAFAKKKRLSLVMLLLATGADSNQTNSVGQSALHVCHPSDSLQDFVMLKLLIRHGGNVNLRDNSGRTPLHCACADSSVEVMESFILAGAEGNVIDDKGFTEIHLAAHSATDACRKVTRLMDTFKYEKQVVIEAFETIALTSVQRGDFDAAFMAMKSATEMRSVLKIPKTVLDPLECYDFIKEWETQEELDVYKGSQELLIVQAVLARERIYKGKFVYLEPLVQFQFIPCKL